MASARFDPKQEMKGMWGIYTADHAALLRPAAFRGRFIIDLEFLQQGFSFATNASLVEEKKDFRYYTRNVNSTMLPIVCSPTSTSSATMSASTSKRRRPFPLPPFFDLRERGEAEHQGAADWKGDYSLKLPRDSRWGYGLAGGGGIAFLIRRFEINVRARYYFGLSDVVRNRNKYADNGIDGSENPFWTTPMRSPLDNLTISVGLSYRFNKEGFSTWKPRPKREKNREVFKYGL